MASFFYSAFGLAVRADQPVPGLSHRSRVLDWDVDLSLHPASWPSGIAGLPQTLKYVSERSTDEPPVLHVWSLGGGTHFKLHYSDDTEFVVDRHGTRVWARWSSRSTLDDTATYLLGPVFGFVLRLRGITCLHASAVALGDRAIAFLGPAFAGKSTTAAAFALMGYRVLADDIVALLDHGSTFAVQPAHPQLRLWPDSVALLFGRPDALPRLTDGWEKRVLDLTGAEDRFNDQPLPLAAIYVLPSASHARTDVEAVGGRQSLLTLVANSYVNYLLDAQMRSDEFRLLSRVVSTVPVRLLPPDNGDPTRLCRRVLQDCEARGCTASPTTVG